MCGESLTVGGHAVFFLFLATFFQHEATGRERLVPANCVVMISSLSQPEFGETDLSQHLKKAWPNFPSVLMQIGSVLFCIVTLKSHTIVVDDQTRHQNITSDARNTDVEVETYCSSTLSHPGCFSQMVKSVMLPMTKLILSLHLHRPIKSRAIGERETGSKTEQPVTVHQERRI